MAEFVQLSNIEEGMIVAEPVLNNFGQTLLPSDVTIEKRHIKILKTWNISGIVAKGDESEEEFELSEELVKKALKHIRKRMHWSPQTKLEMNMLQMAIIHTAKTTLNKKAVSDKL